MRQRNLRVVKWIGTIPVIGVCTVCDRSFTVPLPAKKGSQTRKKVSGSNSRSISVSERMLIAEGQSWRPTRSSEVTIFFGWNLESICCFPI
jgi:hypothetical protein